jgi:hypothetical protein
MNRNKIQEILEFEDWDKPLTDETLEELGFDDSGELLILTIMGDQIFLKYKDGVVGVLFCEMENPPVWRTVGSVKMLIEALKGDE